jgi:hypothetical protein
VLGTPYETLSTGADEIMSEIFVPDYHEKEEAWPLVYNLGRLSLEWNMVEQFFTALIWQLLGDHRIGMAVTGGLGNQSRADIVLNLAREQPNNESLVGEIEFACKAFNILRENRNILIHSHTIMPREDGSVSWRRATGKGPSGHLTTLASFGDLEDLIEATARLGLFTCDLIGLIHAAREGREPKRHMERFPMPKKLKQLSDEAST